MKKWIIFAVVFFVLIIAGGIAFYFISLPPKETMSKEAKEQAVTKLLGRKAQLSEVVQKEGSVKYDGKYISFEYPAAATIYEFNSPTASTGSSRLERFEFDLRSPKVNSIVQISANTSNIASGADDSGARLRHSQANLYQESETTIAGVKAIEFIKKSEGVERSLFWVYKDKIYTFVFYGPDMESIKEVSQNTIKTIVLK